MNLTKGMEFMERTGEECLTGNGSRLKMDQGTLFFKDGSGWKQAVISKENLKMNIHRIIAEKKTGMF